MHHDSEPSDAFDRESQFAQKVSDDDLIVAWTEDQSVARVAQRLGIAKSRVRARLARLRNEGRIQIEATPLVDIEQGFNDRLASIPVEGPGGSHLDGATIKFYQQGAKDEFSQTLVKQNLDGISATYKVGRQPRVAVPRPSLISAYEPVPSIDPLAGERIFIWGDTQIGFWAVLDPDDSRRIIFVPFHDEAAIDVAMQALALYRPTRVVIIGDFFDFPQMSRFQQEPEWAQTLQASVDEGEALIAKIRATAGDDARIDFVPGNHETRMQRAIVNNNPALYNLHRPGERHALYSIPSLIRAEHHRVAVAAEYPSGQVWLAERTGSLPGLVATHADPKKRDMRADSIHGHLVLPGIETFAREYEDGWTTYTRMCVSGFGNYSDTGDKVRLTRTMTPSGRSRMAAVQSFGTVEIDAATGHRSFGLHVIRAGSVAFMDRILTSRLLSKAVA